MEGVQSAMPSLWCIVRMTMHPPTRPVHKTMDIKKCPDFLKLGRVCGRCYEYMRGDVSSPCYRKPPVPKKKERCHVSRFVSRDDAQRPLPGLGSGPAPCSIVPAGSALWDYLARDRYDNGDTRQRSTLLAFADEGLFKVCLNDRESERSLWASALTLQEAIQTLDALLDSPAAEWRHYPGQKKGKK